MKRNFALVCFCSLIAVLFLIGAMSAQVQAQDKVIKLKYTNFFPPAHPISKLTEAWCKEVEKRTNGRIKISYFPGNTLCPPTQAYDSVVKGIADIGQTLAAYAAGRFLLTEVLAQPLGYTSNAQPTRTCNAFYQKFKPKEFDDTKIMYIHGHGKGMFHTRKVLSSIADLKGLRIKANAENQPIVTAMGGSPVALPITETYDALQKGLLDGILLPFEALKGWKFVDIVKTSIPSDPMAYTAPIPIFMNKDKWNSLSKEDQKTIEKINEEWVEKQAQLWEKLEKGGEEDAIKKGIKILKPTPEENAQIAEKMKAVRAEWVKKMAAKGLPAQAALDWCLEYIKTHP
jgi:TRAP-type C4-dicarboxylate transport system substrate-binding protein